MAERAIAEETARTRALAPTSERGAESPGTVADRILELQSLIGNQAVQRLVLDGRVQRDHEDDESGTTNPAGGAAPATHRLWESDEAVVATIYPHREAMLRRFVEYASRVELGALDTAARDTQIADLRQTIEQEIADLEALEHRTRDQNGELRELRGVLDRARTTTGALDVLAERRAGAVDDAALLGEVRRGFGTMQLPDWAREAFLDVAGMRYASGHGSWYSARQLVAAIEEAELPRSGRGRPAPTLSEERVTALTALTEEEALARLRRMRGAGDIPDAAWTRIVRQSDLRREATGDFLDASRDERLDARWNGILRRWRAGDAPLRGSVPRGITGWRAEMNRRGALVTTRVVCNELAELLSAARGNALTGGISQNARDFERMQSTAGGRGAAAERAQGSYFRQSGPSETYPPGANLFFIKATWAGSAADHDKVYAVSGARYATPQEPGVSGAGWPSGAADLRAGEVDGWTVTLTPGQPIKRTRGAVTQWMTWSHQATVLRVDGDRVTTMETTSLGAGVNRRSAAGLRSNRTFVGWMPENAMPPRS